MAFSEFSFQKISAQFNLTTIERDWYSAVPEVAVPVDLHRRLKRDFPLARAIATEKARSELLIAPILVELRQLFHSRISLFSGIEFPAAPEQGLNGVCDYLLSCSAQQQFLTAPVVAIVEAKNDNIKQGLGQCIAEMVGAGIFNARAGREAARLYGVVTTGELWQFLQLEGLIVGLDTASYHIDRLPQILGILTMMLGPPPTFEPVEAVAAGHPS